MEEAMGQLEANKVRDGLYYGNELVEAVRCGDLERCKKIITLPVEEGGLLLLRYFGEDKQGNSALNLAAKNGHTEVVKLLLGQKCCADIKSVELARENGHQEIVALIKSFKNKDI